MMSVNFCYVFLVRAASTVGALWKMYQSFCFSIICIKSVLDFFYLINAAVVVMLFITIIIILSYLLRGHRTRVILRYFDQLPSHSPVFCHLHPHIGVRSQGGHILFHIVYPSLSRPTQWSSPTITSLASGRFLTDCFGLPFFILLCILLT